MLESSLYQRVMHTLQRHKPTTLLRLSEITSRALRSSIGVSVLVPGPCHVDMKYMLILHASQVHTAVKVISYT